MRRILVTGSSGFIGTNLLDRCLHLLPDAAVVGVDLEPPRVDRHRDVWSKVDVTSTDELLGVMREFQPSELVHLAANVDQAGTSMTDYAVNVDGVSSALQAAAAYGGLRRAVWASTRLVCPLGVTPVCDLDYAPPNFYARTKVIGEQLVRLDRSGLESVIVRPTSIWGPWGQDPYRSFFLSLARGTYLHPRGASILKHYGFVGNLAHQVMRLLEAPSDQVAGRTFYLADPEPTELGAFADLVRSRLGLPPVRRVPLGVLRGVAWGGDVLQHAGRRAPLTSDRLSNLRTPMLYDLDALAQVVGPPAYPLEEAVDATLDHLRERGDITR